MRRRQVLVAVGMAMLSAACGGPSKGAADTRERDLRNAYERVAGNWRLTSFQPDSPLGPPFDALVGEQVGKLQVTMGDGILTASGVGFSATRRYEIISATPDAAQAQLIDDAGVRFDLELLFSNNQLFFVNKTSPWRGKGTLLRVS